MKKEEIIKKVKTLGFPKGSYIVFGSCPLAAAGLRESNDIDILVTPEIYELKKKEGWKEIEKGDIDRPLARDDFELHQSWNFNTYKPTLVKLLETATVIDGVPFASLEEVQKWKKSSGRPKDLKDLKLMAGLLTDSDTGQ